MEVSPGRKRSPHERAWACVAAYTSRLCGASTPVEAAGRARTGGTQEWVLDRGPSPTGRSVAPGITCFVRYPYEGCRSDTEFCNAWAFLCGFIQNLSGN